MTAKNYYFFNILPTQSGISVHVIAGLVHCINQKLLRIKNFLFPSQLPVQKEVPPKLLHDKTTFSGGEGGLGSHCSSVVERETKLKDYGWKNKRRSLKRR